MAQNNQENGNNSSKRGLASADPATRRRVAELGGLARGKQRREQQK